MLIIKKKLLIKKLKVKIRKLGSCNDVNCLFWATM